MLTVTMPLLGNNMLGGRMRTLRMKKGLSLDDVWRKSGIHKSTLSSFENRPRGITYSTICKLDVGLNLSEKELVYLIRGKRKNKLVTADDGTIINLAEKSSATDNQK